MQVSSQCFLVAILGLIAPSFASAEIFSQLNGFGQTFTLSGGTSALSQFDTTPGLAAPLLPAMASSFDDFTLANTGQVDQIQWTGAYNGAAGLRASAFRISFYQDNAGAVGTQIGSTIIAPIASLAETSNSGNHFSYSYTPVAPLVLSGGTKTWMSVVAALDFGDDGIASATKNSWGWAFNKAGNSFQTTQSGPLSGGFFTYETFNDPVDYSFRLTTTVVPEPSSCLLLAGAIGGVAVRRLRKGRNQAV